MTTTLPIIKRFCDLYNIKYSKLTKPQILNLIKEKNWEEELNEYVKKIYIKKYINDKLTENEYIHFSKECRDLKKIEYSVGYFKPNGFWLSTMNPNSDDTAYDAIIGGNMPISTNYIYIIKLKTKNNIYKITNINELNKFQEKYLILPTKKEISNFVKVYNKITKIEGEKLSDQKFLVESKRTMQINWEKVKSDGYDGISIIPYIDREAFKLNFQEMPGWYSSWYCDSICLWNLNCIEEYECLNFIEIEGKF